MNITKKKNITLEILAVLTFLTPSLASAFSLSTAGVNFKSIICYILSILYLVIPILFGLAIIFFFWGLSKFILNSTGNEKEIQVGKSYMVWGLVALFVLVSFRAIISIITGQFGFGNASFFPFIGGSASSSAICGERELTPSIEANFLIELP